MASLGGGGERREEAPTCAASECATAGKRTKQMKAKTRRQHYCASHHPSHWNISPLDNKNSISLHPMEHQTALSSLTISPGGDNPLSLSLSYEVRNTWPMISWTCSSSCLVRGKDRRRVRHTEPTSIINLMLIEWWGSKTWRHVTASTL